MFDNFMRIIAILLSFDYGYDTKISTCRKIATYGGILVERKLTANVVSQI